MVDAKFMYEANFIYKLFDNIEELDRYSDMLAKKIVNKNKLFLSDYKTFIGR
jgi:hypothetical protein